MNAYYQPDFPVTDEMPAVLRRPPRRGGGVVEALAAVTVLAIIGVGAFVLLRNNFENGTAASEPTTVPVPQATVSTGSTEVVELEPEPATLWKVVGVEGGLNVRNAPGTSTAIIGAFGASERNIVGTGERAEVNGAPWTQVELSGGVLGWVSSRFLAVDDGTAEPTPTPEPVSGTLTSTVCFQSRDATPFRTLRLNYFDRTNIQGDLRTDQGGQIMFETVTGTLEDGRARVVIQAVDSEESREQDWRFDPASLQLSDDESVRVVDCGALNNFFP